jgi:hypothetical protein
VKPLQVVTLPAITRNIWYFISHSRDTVNKTTSTSINGGAFITQSYTDEMEILYLNRVRMFLGGVSATSDVSNQSQSSIGNFSLFNHILSLKDVKSIYDLDKNLYEPEIIVEPIRDIRKPPLTSGLTIDFNFNENSLISDDEVVEFDGINFVANDGFVTIPPGEFLELNAVIPSYIAQSNTDHSWVVQFRSDSGDNGLKFSLTTSPSSINLPQGLTGVHIWILNHIIEVRYYKGTGSTLVNIRLEKPLNFEFDSQIHQIVTTYTPSTQTLKLYLDDEPPLIATASVNEPIFYGPGSTIVLNKWIHEYTRRDVEYHRQGCQL